MSVERTDEAIVARLAVGDTRAFPVLVERYRRRVYFVFMRATVDFHPDDREHLAWFRVKRWWQRSMSA